MEFGLRDRFWGRLRLRGGLPRPERGPQAEGEQAFYALLLERALPAPERDRIGIVRDVGCRNWSYARAVARAFPRAELVGIELDGGRRYWNLYRRGDAARAHAEDLILAGRSARCVFGDFRAVPLEARAVAGSSDATLFFFPFVSPRPCLRWGLPPEYADFPSLLAHARDGSMLLSCHQGQWEGEIARAAYLAAGMKPIETVVRASEFAGLWPSPHDVHVLVARGRRMG